MVPTNFNIHGTLQVGICKMSNLARTYSTVWPKSLLNIPEMNAATNFHSHCDVTAGCLHTSWRAAIFENEALQKLAVWRFLLKWTIVFVRFLAALGQSD